TLQHEEARHALRGQPARAWPPRGGRPPRRDPLPALRQRRRRGGLPEGPGPARAPAERVATAQVGALPRLALGPLLIEAVDSPGLGPQTSGLRVRIRNPRSGARRLTPRSRIKVKSV